MSNNNKSLFASLHKKYQPMVMQMCMGFVKGDADLAKDLSQDIFINTWNSLDKFKGESGYKTWIYRITVNTCLKYIRDKKDKNRVDIDNIGHNLKDDSPAYNESAYESLYKAIGQLEEVDRLIIMMVLDELKYDEISNIMGISEVNLRVKIHRIKKNLKKILENEQ